MYGLLWRAIPGPAWFKLFVVLVLLLAAVVVCMVWVFPQIADLMPFNDGTLTNETTGPTP